MKEVIIIAGAKGTGKTTFARYYSEKYPYDFINPDDIARESGFWYPIQKKNL